MSARPRGLDHTPSPAAPPPPPLPAGETFTKPPSASSITWKFFCRPLFEPARGKRARIDATPEGHRARARAPPLITSSVDQMPTASERYSLVNARQGVHPPHRPGAAVGRAGPMLHSRQDQNSTSRNAAARCNPCERQTQPCCAGCGPQLARQRTALDGLLDQPIDLRDVHDGDVHLVRRPLRAQRGRPAAARTARPQRALPHPAPWQRWLEALLCMSGTGLPAAYKTRWHQASYTASTPGAHAIAWAANQSQERVCTRWVAGRHRAIGERVWLRHGPNRQGRRCQGRRTCAGRRRGSDRRMWRWWPP